MEIRNMSVEKKNIVYRDENNKIRKMYVNRILINEYQPIIDVFSKNTTRNKYYKETCADVFDFLNNRISYIVG